MALAIGAYDLIIITAIYTAIPFQPDILCGWSGRLEQSPTTYSFGTLPTFKNMLKTHLFSRSYFTD